ncbi:phage holin family protein, partial [Enterococcus hirae]|nr:phage holin family protein [Enterococcus hirae]
MLILSHLFEHDQKLIHLFFLVVLLDLLTGWLKAKLNREWNATLSWNGLWVKISHFILIVLAGIIDIVLSINGIKLEITLAKVFTTCL